VLDTGGILDDPHLDTGCRFNPVFPQHRLRIGHEAGLELRVGPRTGHDLAPLFLLESLLLGHGFPSQKDIQRSDLAQCGAGGSAARRQVQRGAPLSGCSHIPAVRAGVLDGASFTLGR
jgi:hypothetical protein